LKHFFHTHPFYTFTYIMTYSYIQFKLRLPTDVWRLIFEFNHFLFINNLLILDLSRINLLFENILPHIHCNKASFYQNYIVFHISRYQKYTVSYNPNNQITVTFTRSCSFCKPTCKYCYPFVSNAEEQEHGYSTNCYNNCCCIVSFIY